MAALFAALRRAVEGALLLAAVESLAWGVLSVVLSPRQLASIPRGVGDINRQGQPAVRRAVSITAVFSLGILATLGIVVAVAAAAGRMLGDVGPCGNYTAAAVFLLMGLYLLDLLPLPWPGLRNLGVGSTSHWGAALLGLLIESALGLCTLAYVAPILAVTFGLASQNHPTQGCSRGCPPLATARCSWPRGTKVVKVVCKVRVILTGRYLIYAGP